MYLMDMAWGSNFSKRQTWQIAAAQILTTCSSIYTIIKEQEANLLDYFMLIALNLQ